MPSSPIKNFICVLVLLAAMAVGVAMTTRVTGSGNKENIARTAKNDNAADLSNMVNVEVRMLFSHPPTMVKVQGFGVDARPEGNELEFNLTVPAESVTELPLDIIWSEQEDAHYFTQITVRQDGLEDDVIVFTDQYSEFSDIFEIDTRVKQP